MSLYNVETYHELVIIQVFWALVIFVYIPLHF